MKAFVKTESISNARSVFLMLFVVIITLTSCEKEPNYSYQIIFENATDDNLITKLYPKAAYPISYWESYANIDEELREVSIDMDTFHRAASLYSCIIPNIPEVLLTELFDSIVILTFQEEDTSAIIMFAPDTAVGYIGNPYSDHELWVYKYYNGLECSMTCEPVESEAHIFTIEESKYR